MGCTFLAMCGAMLLIGMHNPFSQLLYEGESHIVARPISRRGRGHVGVGLSTRQPQQQQQQQHQPTAQQLVGQANPPLQQIHLEEEGEEEEAAAEEEEEKEEEEKQQQVGEDHVGVGLSTRQSQQQQQQQLQLLLPPPALPSVRPCQSLYVDLGSNIGVQIRKLFEPSKYPGASVLPFFDEFFGPVDMRRQNTCAFGFEANPKHMKRLKQIEQAYQALGWRTTYMNRVVLDVGGHSMDFVTEDDSKFEDWGAHATLARSRPREAVGGGRGGRRPRARAACARAGSQFFSGPAPYGRRVAALLHWAHSPAI
eukprot:COSAG01_NODE_9916_length_2302_cov_2.195642_3_plen_310_part_00